MDIKNTVMIKQNYGEICFYFKEWMDNCNINRNQLATRAGIRFEVADRYYRGLIERIDTDVLARICFVLNCSVGDVIKYQQAAPSK